MEPNDSPSPPIGGSVDQKHDVAASPGTGRGCAAGSIEAKLEQTTRRLDAIINNTKMAIFMMDERQHCAFMNKAAEELTGYTFEETRGRPLHDVIHHTHPDGRPYPLEECPIDRAFPEENQVEGEEVFVHRDGHFYPVAFTASPIRDEDGKAIGTVIEARNVAREKAQDAALRESEARFRDVANAAPVLIWLADTENKGTWYNKAWLDFTGRTMEQELGHGWIDSVHPDDRERAAAICGGSFDVREPFRLDFRMRRSDGEWRVMDDTGVPRFAEDGTFVGYIGSCVDVTEARRSEEALRESERRLRALFENAGVGMTEIDADWRIVSANAAYCRIAGRPETELIGESCLAFTAPEDVDRSQAALDSLLGQGSSSVSFEKRYVHADGRTIWIRSNVTRIEQPEGGDRFLKIVEDITEAKEAEAALAEAQEALRIRGEQFQTLADNIPALAWMAYADGHIFWYNKRWYEYTGTTPETQEGWGWESVHDPAMLPAVVGRWKHSLATGEPFEMVFPLKRADGMFRPFLTRVVPIRDESGEIVRWFGTNVDVTDRIRAEEQLREEGHNLEILNSIGTALSGELDLERVVQMVTDAGVGLTGAKFGAFFYNVLDEQGESYMLYTLSGADRSQFEGFAMPRKTKVFAPTFAGEGIVRSDDITQDPRYGHNSPYKGMPTGHLPVRSYLAVPVVSRTGEVIGGLFFGHPARARFEQRHESLMEGIAAQAAIAIDNARLFREAQREIDQRVKAEQALTALNETLESRVLDEIDRRSRAEEALRQAQKMETVGQLSGGIAHDFNNLLQVIQGNLSILQQALPAEQERWHRAVRNAITGTERAAGLTRRLLAFSRRQPLDPRPVDLNRLIADMSELLRRTLGETINVEMDLDRGPAIAEVDRNQLENSILNLAINARDAMPEGGVLRIATDAAEVDEAFAQLHPDAAPGEYVRVSVIDTGEGMSPETLARAIEPFFTTKEVGRGTGLGLSMVYGFVRQSGGHLELKSSPGEGTRVDVYLPRARREAEAEREPEPAEVANGNGETILLCEDDEDVRRFSADSLTGLGYRVAEAADAESALDLLRTIAPVDLLFTDVVLPGGKTGVELAREAREIQPGLRVLFTTGYARSALDDNAVDGHVEVLPKPFTFGDLAHRLRQILDKG